LKVLLDTSIFIRVGNEQTPLSTELTEALVQADEILVSPISRAEIGIKLSIGKLRIPAEEATYWRETVTRLQAIELPFTADHASRLAAMPLHHRDPFDRMIAAQCLAENLHLATTDRIFTRYGVAVLL
jgi:PIN domain nuclease of toxin-antitoxin system